MKQQKIISPYIWYYNRIYIKISLSFYNIGDMNQFTYSDPNKITVKINGEAFSCTEPTFLGHLLEYLDFNTQTIIVEYNSMILNERKLDSVKLQHKDKIEVVTIVGGG